MYSMIAFDGQVYGPVDVRTLIEWCQQGRIVAATHLVEIQTGRTFLAADMPELRMVLAQNQAPTPQAYAQSGQTTQFSNPYGQAPNQNPYGAPQYPGQFQPGPFSQNGYAPGTYGAYAMPKKRSTALLLCFLFGGLGVHRFYLGHNTSGLGLLIVGLLGCVGGWYFLVISIIWCTVDFLRIASGSMRDSQGVLPV